MLSRVAAVMAPRTHNRRRVTGSSGRRREGRESERQRPNMSRRVFNSAVPLLLVVMMCCSTCGAAAAVVKQSSDPKYQWKGVSEGDVTVESLGVPGLLKVGSDVFAVAEAQCKKDGEDTFTGVASQLLTLKGDNTPEEVLKDARVIQVLEEGVSTSKEVDVSRPTTVVKGSDIYMLVGKYSGNAGGQESAAAQSGLLLVKGTVSAEGGDSGKKIQWNVNQLPAGTLSEGEQPSSLTGLIGSGGSGVKMKDGALVFPLEGTKTDGTGKDEKTVSLLILKDTENWTLSKGMSADGCSDPSVVEREKDKLMMMTACDDGRRRVYESADKGNTWTEALGTLSRVWGNKQKGEAKAVGSGFITATFGDEQKNVMLVTLPVYAKENKKGELHLWLTDNTHIVVIGPVSGKDDDAAASSLLYKSGTDGNNELIALYEKKVDGESSNSLWSVRLTEQLQRVKEVLATWKEVDKRVSELCSSGNAVQARSTDSACKKTKITAGLVGFLSGNFSENTWKDEYLGVNATVKRAEDGAPAGVAESSESADGVKFTGAWAEWPVGEQGENQLYHFANYNFTLVATVSIDGEPKEGDTHIPLMGAKLNGNDNGKTILLGLSYDNKEKKWILLCGDGKKTVHSSTWETRTDTTEYQVAIVLQNGNQGSAYVDGQRVGDVQCQLEVEEDKKISHFYIGGDEANAKNTAGQGDVSVTVRDVLLYNRPLDGNEITALNAIKPPITPPKETIAQEIVLPSSGRTPQAGNDPLNGDEGAGGGIASSAASIATTPSSDVAQTVATMSGETVQGDGSHQTRDVSMSSGEDGETAGGTDGQEEEIHPQDREVNAAALSSSLGNLSQGNNTDAGTVRGSGLLPLLLLLLLGLWGFAAL
ncbi:trans-sialidase [Trypanosoma cruzi Dm28c]|uniref:Trans-sialidase n=2 Tax=Trypanosoma cruzi TaxID=5693 RepID=V5A3L7_TRYCR|nr:trans-sialidase [Trypanosoma cruzi Dm28c]PBJ68066.1 trans-sialidase [Trypanosoma cruzi cruzi]PWU92533.1 putative trans-sialidase, Group VI [Trypanosoma cruzi]